MKSKLIILFLLLVFLTSCTIEQPQKQKVNSYIHDSGEIKVYFCPKENCEQQLVSFINSAKESVYCALFDIGLNFVKKAILNQNKKGLDVKIITDNDYVHKFNHSFVKTDSYKLMHNKFCIIDNKKFSTGSMNPTENGAFKNNNNLLLIKSDKLTQNYLDEFNEMWNGEFKSGNSVKTPGIILNNKTRIKNYFCPEDNCAYHVKQELKQAEKEIYFMTFSFTHSGIANILLLKHLDGIKIQGVMEARQVSKFSQFERLKYNEINVVKDFNKQNMHHKVFIIDNETVITGSFNPTNNGDKGNDENLIIIKDKGIAKEFLEEFGSLYINKNITTTIN